MSDRPRPARFPVTVLLVCLSACAAPPRPEAPPPGPPPRTPAVVYEITESDVAVRVYRDGPLAGLGHNHVIASTALGGRVELREPLSRSTLELSLPLEELVVDEAARRLVAGTDFPDNLTEADRAATRRNMLGPALLDAARFPVLRLTSVATEGAAGAFRVTARADLAGRSREIVVPVVIELGDGVLAARGEFTLTHADLGLVPFSVALGALRVRDDMLVSYRLVARRTGS